MAMQGHPYNPDLVGLAGECWLREHQGQSLPCTIWQMPADVAAIYMEIGTEMADFDEEEKHRKKMEATVLDPK